MTEHAMPSLGDILDFWFDPENKSAWFKASPEMDEEIRLRFEGLWQQAADGSLNHLIKDASSALAMVILLDQFPLNMYRDDGIRYSTADAAAKITRRAIQAGWDEELGNEQKAFLYMPLMHSEKLVDQDLSIACYEKAGLQENLRFARHHRDIVKRFGRFPHRNQALGRESTPKEQAYLDSKEAFKA